MNGVGALNELVIFYMAVSKHQCGEISHVVAK